MAVYAGEGRALVLAQELEPTQRTLSKLAVVLLVVGVSGVVLAALDRRRDRPRGPAARSSG